MVRINLISPKKLADQHLIAEYDEILMLLGYVRKYPKLELEKISKNYVLGKGHILFFKNKLKYLQKRHELIRKEMKRRGFETNKRVVLSEFSRELRRDWRPSIKDYGGIKERLRWKIKNKPNYYRYYGKKKSVSYLLRLLKE
ncbi:MAG: pyrimidine dimer DNA glycosylase/endonuclease V [Candidatus Woesearchaeota archaeon]